MEKIRLKWKNYELSQYSQFFELLRADKFTDCALAADGQTIKAHRVILAAASPFFEKIFSDTNETPTVVVMTGLGFGDVCNVIEYIYTGSLEIEQDQLVHFLDVGKTLKLSGVENFSVQHPEGPEASIMDEMEKDIKVSIPLNSIAPPKSKYPTRLSIKRETLGYAFKCKHCHHGSNNLNTIKNHQRYCDSNPHRSVCVCPFCNKEVRPGSMTYHKRTVHGYVPTPSGSNRRNSSTGEHSSSTTSSETEMSCEMSSPASTKEKFM